MDRWQALCGELLTFHTSGARQQADEARAQEAELKSQLGDCEKRSQTIVAQSEKAAKRAENLDEMLRCESQSITNLPYNTNTTTQESEVVHPVTEGGFFKHRILQNAHLPLHTILH